MEHIEDLTKNGKCSNCGECCGSHLPMMEHEVTRIRRLIKKQKIKPTVRGAGMVKVIDMRCPFLSNENKCRIYKDRPEICKAFICNEEPTIERMQNIKGEVRLIDLRRKFFDI